MENEKLQSKLNTQTKQFEQEKLIFENKIKGQADEILSINNMMNEKLKELN